MTELVNKRSLTISNADGFHKKLTVYKFDLKVLKPGTLVTYNRYYRNQRSFLGNHYGLVETVDDQGITILHIPKDPGEHNQHPRIRFTPERTIEAELRVVSLEPV